MIMNFLSIHELAQAVEHHEQFTHEIKGKRVRKQLAALEEFHHERLAFKNFQISSYGLSFYVQVQHEHRLFDFEVLIDFEYPFNRPSLFYQHESSPYANGQDLLGSILDGGDWGPSMLLSGIFQKLPSLAKHLAEESEVLRPTYHLYEFYEEALLVKYKVELFNVEQYEWKYMIKSTHSRLLGLTKEHLLKFTVEGARLRLAYFVRIKDIREANANLSVGRFKLDIAIANQNEKTKLYFGGDESDAERILYFMNPIQANQRALGKLEKKDLKGEELQTIIQKYSELIEYYSLRDQEKSKRYVSTVQELIRRSFENEQSQQPRELPKEQQIKT